MDYQIYLEQAQKIETFRKLRLPADHPCVKTVADFLNTYYSGKRYRPDDLSVFISKLSEGLVATVVLPDTTKQENPTLTPQSILDAKFIEEDLVPHVKHIRLALFGTPNSPFKELDEAMRWIEDNKSSRTDELIDRTVYEGQVFESKRKGSKVDRLFQEAYQISNFTGATFGSSVMHILINSSLVLQRIQWLMMGIGSKSKSFGEFSRKSRKLVINGPITFEEMRLLHRDIRRYFGKTKSKEADTEDLEFYTLVDGKGGPPTKRVVAFWEEIRHEWNQRYPEKKYTIWKGVQRRYNSLVKRLKPSRS